MSFGIEKELLYAQKENKKTILCKHKDIDKDKLKFDLSEYQEIIFDSKIDLVRTLYSNIEKIEEKKNIHLVLFWVVLWITET